MRAKLARVLPCRMLFQIRTDETEYDSLEVHARLLRLHVRDEDPRRRMRSLGRPLLGRGEREDACPCRERGDNLEWLGKRAGTVAT
jgi:hypothetical protein